MRGITEERVLEIIADRCCYDESIAIENYILPECQELNPWKPIDKDTPTDRALLIVFDDREIYTGIMRKTDAGETYWLDVGGLDFSYGTDIPTHWMELPQPPTTQDQNAKAKSSGGV